MAIDHAPDHPPDAAATDPARLSREAARSVRHPLTRTLLLLTFGTGLVDAASYLGLGHVFAANMTGNIVLLGFGIAGSRGLPVVAPLVSLAAFLAGAGASVRLGAPLLSGRRRGLSAALVIETGLVAGAAILAAGAEPRPGTVAGYLVIALLAFAMGIRNAVVRKVAVPDLTTTVLTMTLTGLAADARLFGGSGTGTARRSAAVVAMLLGAVVGALLVRSSLALVLAVAAGLGLTTLIHHTAAGPGPSPAS
jgi:uncharacterized membrane protein YoaK (UPF0700 family)